ncbi:hypothetical protein CPLU01_12604 [Colletotrichum plurivorum]|uniref:Uncharacterized protein n=1 Tax=Colletotrichum plurivorum TaxID=2175906 RepID=A0A8H6N673_9PEZI|nr:hypothetical protein CPLU01_12604 [Colletotrichum plurivorum]
MSGPTTTAVAILVAVLLLLAISLIAIVENRKRKKRAAAARAHGGPDLERYDTQLSVASFDTIDGLKAPAPVARNMFKGRRFLRLTRARS